MEPGFPENALYMRCGRGRRDVKSPGYVAVGKGPAANQLKDFLFLGESRACRARASVGI